MKGEYKITHKKVVSNFSRERMDESISSIRLRIVTVRHVGLCPYYIPSLHIARLTKSL
jgi:hypothetical protein